jgi:hypothetical protein
MFGNGRVRDPSPIVAQDDERNSNRDLVSKRDRFARTLLQ